jgi:hypothetical protein
VQTMYMRFTNKELANYLFLSAVASYLMSSSARTSSRASSWPIVFNLVRTRINSAGSVLLVQFFYTY